MIKKGRDELIKSNHTDISECIEIIKRLFCYFKISVILIRKIVMYYTVDSIISYFNNIKSDKYLLNVQRMGIPACDAIGVSTAEIR